MTTTFRASKEGYVTASAIQRQGSFTNYLLFELDVPEPAVAIVGEYTLTLTADPSCVDLPDGVRERSYPITITPTTGVTGFDLHAFSVNLNTPPFLPHYSQIWIGISGSYVAMYFAGDYGSLAEQLAADTYVHFEAYSSATIEGLSVTSITSPFDGVVEYCQQQAGTSFSYRCPTTGAVSRVSCKSQNHTLRLRRR